MELYVSNEQEALQITPELEKLFKRVLETTLRAEREEEEVEISLLLVDDKRIQELNYDFRNINQPTDVLSFPLRETKGDGVEIATVEDQWLLGDIVISVETAQRQAKEYGHSLERELGFLLVHGCLHLLGYDHETEAERFLMREKEESVLTTLGLTR
jgi:probable rRNA maturation factor